MLSLPIDITRHGDIFADRFTKYTEAPRRPSIAISHTAEIVVGTPYLLYAMESLRNDSPTSGLDRRPSTSGEISRNSCIQCRLRKVRCDRMQPCSTCLRNKVQCIFQEVRQRRRRVTQTLSTDIVARIERLEERIDHMSGICSLPGKSFMSASDPLMGKRDQAASSRTIHAEHEPPERVFPTPSTHKALSESGRLAVQKGKSRYVSSTIWNVLANNVGTYISESFATLTVVGRGNAGCIGLVNIRRRV
jgi:hypothetical protein